MGLRAHTEGLEASSPADERGERLVYLSDMVSELQELAAREGCATLAGLLAVAQLEALIQARRASATAVPKA